MTLILYPSLKDFALELGAILGISAAGGALALYLFLGGPEAIGTIDHAAFAGAVVTAGVVTMMACGVSAVMVEAMLHWGKGDDEEDGDED